MAFASDSERPFVTAPSAAALEVEASVLAIGGPATSRANQMIPQAHNSAHHRLLKIVLCFIGIVTPTGIARAS